MDWQLLPVGVVVVAAGYYLVRQTLRSWSGSKSGCGGSCGCSGKEAGSANGGAQITIIPAEQLTARMRR